MDESVKVHKRVKKALIELDYENLYPFLNVQDVAEEADTDVRTCKRHLSLLAVDGLGKYGDERKKTFSPSDKLEEVTKRE